MRPFWGYRSEYYEKHSADWSTRLVRDEHGNFVVVFYDRYAGAFVQRETARIAIRALKRTAP